MPVEHKLNSNQLPFVIHSSSPSTLRYPSIFGNSSLLFVVIFVVVVVVVRSHPCILMLFLYTRRTHIRSIRLFQMEQKRIKAQSVTLHNILIEEKEPD